MPENCQLEICGASGFGDLMAAAVDPTDNPHGYKIYVLENKKIKPALAEGDRFIARLSRKNDTWWAKPLARTMTAGVALEQIYGVIVEKNGLFLSPLGRKKLPDGLPSGQAGKQPCRRLCQSGVNWRKKV